MRKLTKKIMGEHSYRVLTQRLDSLKRTTFPKREPEHALLKRYVGDGDVAFEIGANYGQYASDLSRLVGRNGTVYAFEPAQITYSCLVDMVNRKKLTNVQPYHCALSDRNGEDTLHTPIKKKGNYGVATATIEPDLDKFSEFIEETITTETLDSFVARKSIKRMNFVRCDVEGCESRVLRGGMQSIRTFRPPVLMEVHPGKLKYFGDSIETLLQAFKEIEYEAFRLDGDRLEQVEILENGNHFFIPVGNRQ